MSSQEREAWANVAVVSLTIAVWLILIPLLGIKTAFGAFGILGLLGLTPFLSNAGRKRGRVLVDERDRLIRERSVVVAYAVFWVAFVGTSMGVWAANRDRGTISVDLLPLFPFIGWMIITLVQGIATLVQYRQGQ
jgi:hypothetical protein